MYFFFFSFACNISFCLFLKYDRVSYVAPSICNCLSCYSSWGPLFLCWCLCFIFGIVCYIMLYVLCCYCFFFFFFFVTGCCIILPIIKMKNKILQLLYFRIAQVLKIFFFFGTVACVNIENTSNNIKLNYTQLRSCLIENQCCIRNNILVQFIDTSLYIFGASIILSEITLQTFILFYFYYFITIFSVRMIFQ